jgi:hypothetical protein
MCCADTCVICLSDAKFKRLSPSRALAIQKIRNKANLPQMGERLKCGHIFHRKCILPWFLNLDSENSYNCPMCRGEIVFSNNLGMRNGPLFERKSYLEYKKAYEEGYYNDEDYSEDGYDDEESEGDEYDEEESEVDEYDDVEESEDDEYDDVEESEDGETISEKDYMDPNYYDQQSSQSTVDLQNYLTHELEEIEFDENDFNNERNRFDEENRLNTIRSSSLVSYRCQFRMCQKGIAYLTQPNPTKYTFRPHPCSYLD